METDAQKSGGVRRRWESPAFSRGKCTRCICRIDGFGKTLSDFVTAREAHLCGERGSPALAKDMVCLQVGYAPQSGGKHRQAVLGG